MIIGTCPYKGCDEPLMLEAPDCIQFPAYLRHECKRCKRFMWTKFSRIDPCSWTERNFLKEYKIDKKTKIIELRHPPKPLTPKELLLQAVAEKVMSKIITNQLIYGTGFDFKDITKGMPIPNTP